MSITGADPLQRLQSLTVADVMTRQVTTIPACAPMGQAARILCHANASGAPVVDDTGRCIGVLSAADFLRYQASREDNALIVAPASASVAADGSDTARRFMSAAVQCASADTPLVRAAETMCLAHIHRLIVLDDCGAPVGLVSTLDVMSAMIAAVDEAC